MLSRCFLDFSVRVGAFVIGLSQISSFFSQSTCPLHCIDCRGVFFCTDSVS